MVPDPFVIVNPSRTVAFGSPPAKVTTDPLWPPSRTVDSMPSSLRTVIPLP